MKFKKKVLKIEKEKSSKMCNLTREKKLKCIHIHTYVCIKLYFHFHAHAYIITHTKYKCVMFT